MPDHTDAATLQRLYHLEGLTVQEIADRCGVAHSTVQRWMNRHGIERVRRGTPADEPYQDPEVLEQHYVTEGLSDTEIAVEYGVTRQTIRRWRRRHGIGED